MNQPQRGLNLKHKAGLEISQNKICGGECDTCKF